MSADGLINRRVGPNELETLSTLRECVIAEGEYAAIGRYGNPPPFAQTLRSADGRQNGLSWLAVEGAPESPPGPQLTDAAAAGAGRSAHGAPASGPAQGPGVNWRVSLTAYSGVRVGGEDQDKVDFCFSCRRAFSRRDLRHRDQRLCNKRYAETHQLAGSQ